MWGKIVIPMYRLWLHGLYAPQCPLSPKRPINLISLSLSLSHLPSRARKVYVPWEKIYMPRACGHALMSSHAFCWLSNNPYDRHESFQFFNWFPFFFCLLRPFFIIEQNAPKSSKWVCLFHNFPGGTTLQDIFSFFHRNPLPCLIWPGPDDQRFHQVSRQKLCAVKQYFL